MQKEKRKEILEMIGHLCAGLSVLVKGIDKFDHPGNEFIAVALIIIGAIILFISFAHSKLKFLSQRVKEFIFVFEGIVMIFVGYAFMKEGTHAVHYAYFTTAFLYFGAAVYIPKRKAMESKRREKVELVEKQKNENTNSIASDAKNI